MVPPDSHGISRVPRYSGIDYAFFNFKYGTITLYGVAFQPTSSIYSKIMYMSTLQPRIDESTRFGLFPFRSPLLWESRLIYFPLGTEMFHFPRLAPVTL